MLGKLKNLLLGDKAYAETAAAPALASLLVEMARADFDESPDEQREITALLARHFELSDAEAEELLERAGKALQDSVCLFDFTRALHDSLDAEQKNEVIRLLWQIAHADDKICKYEDYLVRKVADLLYVSHADVIRIKHEVVSAAGQ